MYKYYFLFLGGTLGSDAGLVSCAFACLPVLCLFRFVSYYKKKSGIIFLRAEDTGGEKKINGNVNQVNEERNWRATIFLPINPVKMAKINTSRFDVSQLLGDRIDLQCTRSGYSFLLQLVYAEIKA